MKASQIAQGSRYESKKSDEVRRVTFRGSAVVYYVIVPPPKFSRERTHTTTLREFAEWAARPAGKKEDPGLRSIRLAKATRR